MAFQTGYIYLILNIICWTIGNILLKYVFIKPNPFQKPFCISYMAYSSYLIYWIKFIFKRKNPSNNENFNFFKLYLKEIKMAFLLSPISYIYVLLYQCGTLFTSISSALIITSVSDIFTIIFSKLLFGLDLNLFKIISVSSSIIGTLMIGITDTTETGQINPVLGDFLVLLSMILFSLLLVLMNKYIPDSDKEFDWEIFYAISGVIYVICLFPFFFVLNYSGFEVFQFPSFSSLSIIYLYAFIDFVIGDYSYSQATIKLGPLLTDIGLGFITPLGMISDIWLENKSFSISYLIGFAIVTYSVFIVILDDVLNDEESDEDKLPDKYFFKALENSSVRTKLIK